MKIGEKINKFDNQEDNTLKAFNELFKLQIEGNESSLVEIGEPLSGQRRVLFIDGNYTEIFMEIVNEYNLKKYGSNHTEGYWRYW